MSVSYDNNLPPKTRLSIWIFIAIVFLGLIFVSLVVLTYLSGSQFGHYGRLVSYSLQSGLTADYSADSFSEPVDFGGMPLIAQALYDSGEGNVTYRLETVSAALQNPVPTVTPPGSATGAEPEQSPTPADGEAIPGPPQMPMATVTLDLALGPQQETPTSEIEPSPEMTATVSMTGSAPNRVILAAPEGHISTDTPVFQWQPVSEAINYAFSLFSPEGLIHNQLLSKEDVDCIAENRLCRYAPNLVLDVNTAFLFQVMAVNEQGYGPIGDGMMFYQKSGEPDPPRGVTLLSPENGEKVADWTPLLSWQAADGAQWYRVTVRTLDNEVLDKWVAVGDACMGEICALDLTLSLSPGIYSWTIVAFNAGGFGPLAQPFRMDIQ